MIFLGGNVINFGLSPIRFVEVCEAEYQPIKNIVGRPWMDFSRANFSRIMLRTCNVVPKFRNSQRMFPERIQVRRLVRDTKEMIG